MKKKISLILKKIFDFTASIVIFILLLPLFIICCALIYTLDGRPIFFSQDRPGLNEKIFKILKFRTMKLASSSEQNLVDSSRITKLGFFLRKYSLDEIPQLLNVLNGSLSLVGPRPLLVEYLPIYSPRQKLRHSVKPGITGWAQVNGRNSITWEQKFEYDIWYVENWSLMLDFKILLLTFFKVFKSSDINASENITMEKFRG
jgi:sugar transferase EpsL